MERTAGFRIRASMASGQLSTWFQHANTDLQGAGEACGAELLQATASSFFVWGQGMS
jgi:hypothetical protein